MQKKDFVNSIFRKKPFFLILNRKGTEKNTVEKVPEAW